MKANLWSYLVLIALCPLNAWGIDIPGPISANPLHWAARNNDLAAAATLLKKDPSLLNSVDADNRTALHYAAAASSLDVLKLLLGYGAKTDVQSRVGVTPILWAMEFGDFDGFKMLVQHHANLELARHEGAVAFPPLSAALYDGRDAYAEVLIRAGANVRFRDEKGWTPLLHATFSNRPSGIVTMLLDRGADANERNNDGNSVLSHALLRGNYDVARLLLHSGADIFATGFDNNRQHDNSQMNMAGWAAYGGDLECLKLALAYGADPRMRDGEGRDALRVAQDHGQRGAEAFLTLALYRLGSGWTSRHFAAEAGLVETLAARGPSVDQAAADGTTPLMIAAARGDVRMLEGLLKSGADPGKKDQKGETALDKATRAEQDAIVRRLRSIRR